MATMKGSLTGAMKTRPDRLAAVAGLAALLGLPPPSPAAPECMLPTGEYLPTQVPYTYVLDRRSPT